MSRRAHLPILTLLAAALFLRSLVPVGWMPVSSAGSVAVQPCPAADPPPIGAHHGGSQHGSHDGECAFAPLHAGFAETGAAPPLAAPTIVSAQRLAPPMMAALPTGPPALPPPATGPPATA
jgi:hypothetical protein